jgi:hypothetical protein
MNLLCQLFFTNLICTRWKHDTSIIIISRHPQVLLKLPDLNVLWYQKEGRRPRIPIHSATPHFEWNISGSPGATQRDKPSCNNDQQTSGLKSFLHSHSLRSFGPPSGFLFGSLVLTQTTANNVDARYRTHSPQPRCFLSSTCPTTILRLGSFSLSSHLGTNPS